MNTWSLAGFGYRLKLPAVRVRIIDTCPDIACLIRECAFALVGLTGPYRTYHVAVIRPDDQIIFGIHISGFSREIDQDIVAAIYRSGRYCSLTVPSIRCPVQTPGVPGPGSGC